MPNDFDVKKYSAQRKKLNKEAEFTNNSNSFDVAQYSLERSAPKTANDILRTLQKEVNIYNNEVKNAQSRYANGENRYIADTEEYLSIARKNKKRYSSQKNDFEELLSKYGAYFDKNFVTSINEAYAELDNGYKSLYDSAKQINDYYSQWENEEAYNNWLSAEKIKKEQLALDIPTAKKEVEEIKSRLTTLDNQIKGLTANESYFNVSQLNGQIDYNDQYAAYYKTNNAEMLSKYKEEYAKLSDELASKKQYLTTAERLQSNAKLVENAKNSVDFEQFSAEGLSLLKNLSNDNSLSDEKLRDIGLTISGNASAIRDAHLMDSLFSTTGVNKTEDSKAKFDAMNEDEKKVYAYYLGKRDTENAKAYLENLDDTLTQRIATGIYEEQYKDNIPAEMIFGVKAGLNQNMEGMVGFAGQLTGNEDYQAPSGTDYISAFIREDLGDKGAIHQGAYDLITTTSNMMPSILTSTLIGTVAPVAGQVVGAGMMGMSASGSAYQEMINLGYNKEQARTYGMLVGASETTLESLLGGISKFGGALGTKALPKVLTTKFAKAADTAIGNIAIKYGSSMLSEFSEESLQEILDPVFQNIAVGYNLNKLSDIELSDVLYAGILGALSAGIFESPGAISDVYGSVNTAKIGQDVKKFGNINDLKTIANTLSADSAAYQIAGKVNEKSSAYTIGKLFNEVGATLSEGNVESIKNNLVSRGMSPNDAQVLAEAYAYGVVNDTLTLTPEQEEVFKNNEVIASAVHEELISNNKKYNEQLQRYIEITDNVLNKRVAEPTHNSTESTAEKLEDIQTDNSNNTTENASETDFSKTTYNGEEVSYKYKSHNAVKLDNGETVDIEDLSLSDDDAFFYETVTGENDILPEARFVNGKLTGGVDVVTANEIREIFGGTPTPAQLKGLGMYFRYGMYNINRVDASVLTDLQRKQVFNLGRAFGEYLTENVSKKTKVKQYSKGKVKYNIKNELNTRQQASVEVIEKLADMFDITFNLYESTLNGNGERLSVMPDGKETTANGYYMNGEIYIDINAGNEGQGAMLYTAAHELTHYIKEWSPKKFKVLADFLVEQYQSKGKNVDYYVNKQVEKARRAGNKDMKYSAAFEEFVADSMEKMLADEKAVEKLVALRIKDKTVFDKLREGIKKLVEKVKREYSNLRPDSAEGKIVADMADVFGDIQDLFLEALDDASNNFQKAEKNTATNDGVKYSMAGVQSKSHDFSRLEQAIHLENVGKATSEEIRQQTGWFRGYDGKWRYEISDRELEVDTRGKFSSNPDVRRYTELVDKVYFDMNATETEIRELQSLEKILEGVSVEPKTLGELVKHDKLFNAYPQLKDLKIYFDDIPVIGAYHPGFKEIVLSKELKLNKSKLEKTLVHEIQHAIQDIEGFAGGSNTEYWRENGIPEDKIQDYYQNTAGEIEARDVANRHWRSEDALKEKRPDIDKTDVVFADNASASSYIKYTEDNKPVVIVENNILEGIPKSQWIDTVKNTISSKFSQGIPISGKLIKVNLITRKEFANSKTTQHYRRYEKQIYKDKFKSANNLDEIVLASTNYVNEDLKHERNDKFTEFARGDVLMRIGNNDYSAKVVIGFTSGRQMVLYDVVDFANTSFNIKKVDTHTAQVRNAQSSRTSVSTDNSVPQENTTVNNNSMQKGVKNSIRDSTGRELTPEQNEYFKDSKVRDEDGNLLVVYHGTSEKFTVFDRNKGRSTMDIQGSFFSPWELDAQGYGENVRAFYLNITNPASEAVGYKALNKFKGQNYAGIKAREYLESLGYDGVNNGNEEYIAFNANQIKAVDNLNPTTNDDIRFSERGNGYDGYSMSNNAREAYENDEKPILKWSKDSIIARVREINPRICNHIEKIPIGILKKKLLVKSSWHHTSMYYNKTDFYSINEDLIERLTENDISKWKSGENESKSSIYKGDFSYTVWEGTGKHKKPNVKHLSKVNIEERGNFYYVTDDNGNLLVKKKIGSNGTKAINLEKTENFNNIREQIKNRILENSTKEAQRLYEELYEKGYEHSNSGILYAKGRKPTPHDYDHGIENFFVKGEKRLFPNMNGGYYVEIWNGENWIMEDNPKINFSERGQSVYELLGENKRLQKENSRLKDKNEYLNQLLKLQRKITHGKIIDRKTVEKQANILLKNTQSKMDKKDLTDQLYAFYTYIIGSEQLVWEDVLNRAGWIANDLLNAVPQKVQRDEYAQEILSFLHNTKISLNDVQKAEAENLYGSFSVFRKTLFGSVIISDNGTPLDSIWQELSESYPETFSKETNPADMPIELADIILNLRDTTSLIEEFDQTQQMRYLAEQIYDGYWNVSTVQTVMDKLSAENRREIQELKYRYAKKVAEMKKQHEKELSDQKAYYREMVNRVRIERNTSHKKQMMDYKAKVLESHARAIEKRNNTVKRNQILKTLDSMEKKLLNQRKEKNIGIEMQPLACRLLTMINLDTVDADFRLDRINSEMENTENPQLLSELQAKADRIKQQGIKKADELYKKRNMLKDIDAYAKRRIKEMGAESRIDDVVIKTLDDVEALLGGTPIRRMNSYQLECLKNAVDMVDGYIKKDKELFLEGKNQTVEDAANAVMNEVSQNSKGRKEIIKQLEWLQKSGWAMLKPETAFNLIGSDTLKNLFNEARKGDDKFALSISDAKKFLEETVQKYGADKWDMDKKYDFNLISGEKVTLTFGEILSLYAYSKRDQAIPHLEGGGFVQVEPVKKKIGKLNIEYTVNEDHAHRLTEAELGSIINSLSKEQKAFADEMQKYLSSVMGKKGNEISMALYQIDIFKEKNYFPLKLCSVYKYFQKNENSKTPLLKNAGMTKPTVEKANDPIVIESFQNVWANHVIQMSRYNAYVLGIENLTKVFGYTSFEKSSVRAALQGAYGEAAIEYIENFIIDLNGGRKGYSHRDMVNISSKLLNTFKKVTVSASLSTAIQQPSAIIRAMSYVKPKYFMKKKDEKISHKENWEELKKYAPIATLKEIGGFDMSAGVNVADYLKQRDYKGKEKLIALATDSKYRDDLLMWGASKADEIAWSSLWNAIKKEQRYRFPNMEKEKFLKICGERFTDVATKTQVYDSVFTRSEIMRSPNEINKMASAFMGEPMTNLNIIVDTIIQRKRGKISRMQAGANIGCVYLAQIVAAASASIVYAMRDDDDDESFVEKYMSAFGGKLTDELLPITWIPYVRDVISLCQGYDVSRTDMSVISDIVDSIKDLKSKSLSTFDKISGIAGSFAAAFGLPLKNLIRDGKAMYNAIIMTFDSNVPKSGDASKAFAEGIFGEKNMAKANDYLAKGKTEKANKIIAELLEEKTEKNISNGKTPEKAEKDAKSSIRSSLTSYWKPIFIKAYQEDDYIEQEEIYNLLNSTGIYGTSDELEDTIERWIKDLE